VPRVTLPLVGVAGSTIELFESVAVVGSGQVWNDASDATYVQYSAGNARSPLAVSPAPVPLSNYKVEVALKTSFSTSQSGFGVSLYQYGFGQLSNMVGGTAYVGPDGWLYCPQLIEFPSNLSDALNGHASAVCIVGMLAAGQVYEGKVVVTWAGVAPPCRNLKRGDRFDLGGARNYPPSKMQQTSSRGVGAY
jgi:hypothetical protein